MDDDGTIDFESVIRLLPEEMSSQYGSRIRACGTIRK